MSIKRFGYTKKYLEWLNRFEYLMNLNLFMGKLNWQT